MNIFAAASLRRALLVWSAATVVLGLIALTALQALTHGLAAGGQPPSSLSEATSLGAGLSFDQMLLSLAALVVVVVSPWCWVLTTITCWDAARGHTLRRPGCPAIVHRTLLALLGIAIVAGGTAPAHALDANGDADAASSSSSVSMRFRTGADDRSTQAPSYAGVQRGLDAGASTGVADPSFAERLDGLPLPDRPVSLGSSRAQPPAATTPSTYVVQPGDCLWNIAADLLPDDASDADVAAATSALYAANVATVGDNPDLIVPGQVLGLPSGDDS